MRWTQPRHTRSAGGRPRRPLSSASSLPRLTRTTDPGSRAPDGGRGAISAHGRGRRSCARAPGAGSGRARRGEWRRPGAELLFRLAACRQLMDDFVAVRGARSTRRCACGRRRRRSPCGSSCSSRASASSPGGLELGRAPRLRGHGAGRAGRRSAARWPQRSAHYASWRYATGTGYDPKLARRAEELETVDAPDSARSTCRSTTSRTSSSRRARRCPLRPPRAGCWRVPSGTATTRACRSARQPRTRDFLDGRSDVARERIGRASALSPRRPTSALPGPHLGLGGRDSRPGSAMPSRALDGRAEALGPHGGDEVAAGEWWMRTEPRSSS